MTNSVSGSQPDPATEALDGKVVIVTGGSRGIGEAIARSFADRGSAVALAARSSRPAGEVDRGVGPLERVAESIRAGGGHAVAVRCNVSDDDDLKRLLEITKMTFGPVDVLVNNAAAFGSGALLEVPLRRYQRCFEINVFAPYRLMQLVLPDMLKKNSGHIVNVTSDASRRPPPGPYKGAAISGAAGYGASKLALEHLTRSAAAEFSDRGIAINAVMPSMPVLTPSVLAVKRDFPESLPMEAFVRAVLVLATIDPAQMTGTVCYSEDLLHPELGTRGWLASI